MDIKDFLPVYPNITNTPYSVLNPYKENFYEAIFRKKEFYENKLSKIEPFPSEKGLHTKYQNTIARYMSSHTPYNKLILVHAMGTGKTCSAIGAIELIKNETNNFKGALIFAKGSTLLDNFREEVVEKCTAGQYIPVKRGKKLTDLERAHRIRKNTKFYSMNTFIIFAKHLKTLSNSQISNDYSDHIIVIDEVHNLRPQDDEEGVDTYNQFHRFLHNVQNAKILLLSGTPMKDGPEEIATVANLLLPMSEQLPTGEDFINEYMIEEKNTYTLNKKASILKLKLKGLISFLKESESSIEKKFIGRQQYGGLKHLAVDPLEMSEFQSLYYNQAYNKDIGPEKQGIWINSREASLFIYPDGTYGKAGFKKYIIEKKGKKLQSTESVSNYSLTQDLLNELEGKTNDEILNNIRKFSSIYASVIEKILSTKGNCFIYSSIVQGSGAILFSLLLELFGFSKAKGGESSKYPRYAILTNQTITTKQLRTINATFNSKANMKGEIIKVIIGSRTVSEGFSFKNVIFESINTPHWNYSETAQAIARGVRLGSHNDLYEAGENPVVNIYQPVSIPIEGESLDLYMYKTSEDKDISIKSVMRLLMEIAFDCSLNYLRNHIEGKDGARDCDYTTCNYKCDGIDMQLIEKQLGKNEIDFSTYQLYYSNPNVLPIRRKIEKMFRENRKIDMDTILKTLGDAFTEDEIINALYILKEESGGTEFDYKDFLRIYSRSSVQKIMIKIEEMFKYNFKINFQTIINNFTDYTEFEILTALQTMINDNITIINKYGLPSYIKEENDVYFLVNSLTVSPDFFIEYYSEYPHVSVPITFSECLENIQSKYIPISIDRMCMSRNDNEILKLLKSLPLDIQEMFIEGSLIAKNKNIQTYIRDKILVFYQKYIKEVDGVYVSTLLQDNNKLRCFDEKEWSDCDKKYFDLVRREEIIDERKKRDSNPYGLLGKWNPENKIFCIVDFKSEKSALANRESDQRIVRAGKNCKSWKIYELISIAVNVLKLPYPADFKKDLSRERMIKIIKDDDTLSKIYDEGEFDVLSDEDLRRVLYWGLPKKDGGNKGNENLCTSIRNFLEGKGLVEIDMNCGVQGKKKIGTEAKERKTGEKNFIIHKIVPSKDTDLFNGYIKDIGKISIDCLQEKPSIDDKEWIIVLSKKKIVAFLSVDKNNILNNVCVAKNYRRAGIGVQAMKQAVSILGRDVSIQIKNTEQNIKQLTKLYKGFGFDITKNDDKFTYMKFKT